MLFLIFTSILWGLSFGLIKSQLSGFDPTLIAFLRLAISFLVFLPFLRKVKPSLSLNFIWIGAVQFGAMYCLYIRSYAYLSGAQIALLTITTPLFVVAWDGLLHRRFPKHFWLAALLSVTAGAILVWADLHWSQRLKGVLLMQAANAVFALGQVLYKKIAPAGPPHRHFAWLYLGGFLVPLGLLLPGDLPTLPQTQGAWLALLYLGAIASGAGFFLWNQGIRRVSNGVVAVMNNLKIPLGAFLAWLIFKEHLELSRWIPCAILFGLAFLPLRKELRNPR